MQNQNASSSSLSDVSQVKYQKAVKEISKLISYNNNLNKQVNALKAICQALQNQNKQLTESYQQYQLQKSIFGQKSKDYEQKLHSLQKLNEGFKKKQQTLFTSSMVQKQRNKHMQQVSILQEKLNEQGHTIIQLQEHIGKLQQDNKEQKINYQKMIQDLKKQIQLQSLRPSIGDCLKCPELKILLRESAQYRMILEKQIIDLKKRQQFSNDMNPKMYINGKDGKSKVIQSLVQRVRVIEEKQKKKNIQIHKLQDKIQKLNGQLQKYKNNQIIFETTELHQEAKK